MRIALFIMIAISLIFVGCTSDVRFYVCPNEFAATMKSKTDIGQKKEVLVSSDCRVLAVHKDKNIKILPVQHYRPAHTFSNRTHPRKVSFDKPLTLTALIVINDIQKPVGIAIKKVSDIDWWGYWLEKPDIDEEKKKKLFISRHTIFCR